MKHKHENEVKNSMSLLNADSLISKWGDDGVSICLTLEFMLNTQCN